MNMNMNMNMKRNEKSGFAFTVLYDRFDTTKQSC